MTSIEQFMLPEGRCDMVGYKRALKIAVYAESCPICGRFAKQVAGDMSVKSPRPGEPEPPGPWYRTDCKKCGVWEVHLHWIPDKGWKPESKERMADHVAD